MYVTGTRGSNNRILISTNPKSGVHRPFVIKILKHKDVTNEKKKKNFESAKSYPRLFVFPNHNLDQRMMIIKKQKQVIISFIHHHPLKI